MATTASVFGPSSGSTHPHLTNMSTFGTSSFGSHPTSTAPESIQPSQQTPFGTLGHSGAMPSFGFGVSSSGPLFGFQSTQSTMFGQSAAMSTQQAAVQPGSFSFSTANSNPFAFGAPSTTAVFSLGKRTNFDGVTEDGNKWQAAGLCSAVFLVLLMQYLTFCQIQWAVKKVPLYFGL